MLNTLTTFFLLAVGTFTLLYLLFIYNNNHLLIRLSQFCRARLAYREAGAAARSAAWAQMTATEQES